MPRSELTTQTQAVEPDEGVLASWQDFDVANGDYFDNDGRTILIVQYATTARTVRFTATVRGAVVTKQVTVGTGQLYVFGPFDPAFWNLHDGTDPEQVYVNQTAGSPGDLEAMLVRLPFSPFKGR